MDAPLHCACINDRPECTKLLLEKGAALDAVSVNNETPLHFAIRYCSLKSVRLLVAAGAPQDVKDDDGKTPRDRAEGEIALEILELLDAAEDASGSSSATGASSSVTYSRNYESKPEGTKAAAKNGAAAMPAPSKRPVHLDLQSTDFRRHVLGA